jgi:endonuclease/exonuclease/phosphatase family metal-dependent hydrolase
MRVVKIQPCHHQPILIVNIYNLSAWGIGAHSTGQRLKQLKIPNTYPKIIAGDFNLHHPDWEEMTVEPLARAREIVEWLQDK